jgi:predicted transporter
MFIMVELLTTTSIVIGIVLSILMIINTFRDWKQAKRDNDKLSNIK